MHMSGQSYLCVCVCVRFCANMRVVCYSVYFHPQTDQYVTLVSTCVRVCEIRCKYACGLGQCILSF